MYGCLSRSGSNGLYLASDGDYRADHVYPGKSLPGRVARSLYVWCSSKLLRAYQKFLIVISLCIGFSMPVYAEEQEFNYEDQLSQIQQLNSIGDISVDYKINDTHVEINDPGNGLVRSPSINPDVNFEFIGIESYAYGDGFKLNAIFQGTIPEGYNGFALGTDAGPKLVAPDYDYYRRNGIAFNLTQVRLYNSTTETFGTVLYSGPTVTFDMNNIGISTAGGSTETYTYLASVQQVFTWILSHITELITFILGNAFLAVGLLLFMCGAVISFFVRIKHA